MEILDLEHQTIDLSGSWNCELPGFSGYVHLPGTLDGNGVGFPDDMSRPWHPDESGNEALSSSGAIATRLTRKHTYEGPAVFSRLVETGSLGENRVFLEIERSRYLSLRVNGHIVPHWGVHTLSTPHIFEVTKLLTGQDVFELTCDNSYPGWPKDDILNSSAATDETQTNWNGLLGYVRLTLREPVFLSNLRVYPQDGLLDVCAEVSANRDWEADIELTSAALTERACIRASGHAGTTPIWLRELPLASGVRRWDESEGVLYELGAKLGRDTKTVSFGIRDFSVANGQFSLNGRTIFLRGETNCAVFPETGYPPMEVDSWREILLTYQAYGVNIMRFHSHCPPEAAFKAADELGILMQAELSNWNPKAAFATKKSRDYYRKELLGILSTLANHPSFVMLSLGNELWANENAHSFMARLLQETKSYDSTRLYAAGSNNHYGQRAIDSESDFYTACSYWDSPLRGTSANMEGWLNDPERGLTTDYREALERIHHARDLPVCSFEVGQFEILPDFDQIDEFHGATEPDNLRLIREKAASRGLLPHWHQYVEATGELALICYRAEVEAALRTPGMGGISLLGLQDFPGQGTALVGMLTSHLHAKPFDFARPERFRAFFTDALPLILLEKFTYSSAETLTARVAFANYGKTDISAPPTWSLTGGDIQLGGRFSPVAARTGKLTELGLLRVLLNAVSFPCKLTLCVSLRDCTNKYDIWVYPKTKFKCPEGVHECRCLDETAQEVLSAGGCVYLAPDSTKETLPGSVKGQFSTDFWSVGTFPAQEGGMGLLIDEKHTLFNNFPTSFHTDWQWRRLAGQFAMPLPEGAQAIVTLMDSYAYMRNLAYIFECRCGGGRLLVSSFGLHQLEVYPEAKALQEAIYRYMVSEDFAPAGEISADAVLKIAKPSGME